MTNKNILVLGATSAIVQATSQALANAECHFTLVARNQAHLQQIAADLRARSQAEVDCLLADCVSEQGQAKLFAYTKARLAQIDLILIGYGSMPATNQLSTTELMKHFDTNMLSVIRILNHYKQQLAQQRRGKLIVISSVAGDRGRKSNYSYGAAKGGLSIYLQGLRGEMLSHNVQVITVKPGFVDTPMTASITDKNFLWAKPSRIAQDIKCAIEKNKTVVYTPKFWRLIMLIVKSIPERIFMRLSF